MDTLHTKGCLWPPPLNLGRHRKQSIFLQGWLEKAWTCFLRQCEGLQGSKLLSSDGKSQRLGDTERDTHTKRHQEKLRDRDQKKAQIQKDERVTQRRERRQKETKASYRTRMHEGYELICILRISEFKIIRGGLNLVYQYLYKKNVKWTYRWGVDRT